MAVAAGSIQATDLYTTDPQIAQLGLRVLEDDLRHFGQWNSRTPGHPEYGHTAGVETTTGPLGQGVATSAGMAIAERWLARRLVGGAR